MWRGTNDKTQDGVKKQARVRKDGSKEAAPGWGESGGRTPSPAALTRRRDDGDAHDSRGNEGERVRNLIWFLFVLTHLWVERFEVENRARVVSQCVAGLPCVVDKPVGVAPTCG